MLLQDTNVAENNSECMVLVSSLKNNVSFLCLVFQNSQGKKRSIADSPEIDEVEATFARSSRTFYADSIVLKKKCVDLEARIKQLEEKSSRKKKFFRFLHIKN